MTDTIHAPAPAKAPRGKIVKAYDDAARSASASIESNPLAVLAGGIALGVLAGAVIPRSEQETKLLKPVGKRIADTASGAIKAAKDTGKAELDVLGLSKAAAKDQVGKLLGGVVKAALAAGSAGAAAAKSAAKPS